MASASFDAAHALGSATRRTRSAKATFSATVMCGHSA